MGIRRFSTLRNWGLQQRKWARDVPTVLQLKSIDTPYTPYTPYTPIDSDPSATEQRINSLIPPVYTQNEIQTATASNSFPIEIDLKDFITGTDPTKDSYQIDVISVEEISRSVLATPWTEDNRFVEVDTNGRIRWVPRGNYLNSALSLIYEVSDPVHPATQKAVTTGNIYTGEISQRPSLPIGGNVAPPSQNELVLGLIDDNIIGNPDKAQDFAQNQGIEPICALASVVSTLIAMGTLDKNGNPLTLEQAIRDATTNITDENGVPIYVAYGEPINRITIIRDSEIPPPIMPLDFLIGDHIDRTTLPSGYISATGSANLEDMRRILMEHGGTMSERQRMFLQNTITYHENDGYDEIITEEIPQNLFPNFAGDISGGSWAGMMKVMEFYGVTPRIGQGREFSTIIKELLAGNPVVVGVDATELYASPSVEELQAVEDYRALLLNMNSFQTRDNHALILSGIDESTDPPTVFVVDSNRGQRQEYPLPAFIAGLEDGDFYYLTTGNPPESVSNIDTLESMILNRISDYASDYASPELPTYFSSQLTKENTETFAREKFLNAIQDGPLLDAIEASQPGTKQIVAEYLTAIDTQRESIKMEYPEIDFEEIQSVITNLDLEDTKDIPPDN